MLQKGHSNNPPISPYRLLIHLQKLRILASPRDLAGGTSPFDKVIEVYTHSQQTLQMFRNLLAVSS